MGVAFGKLPSSMIDSGWWARLRLAEVKAYGVLVRHCCGTKFEATISMNTIARKSGLSTRSAARAITSLRQQGLISVERGGGRNRANAYTLRTDCEELNQPTLGFAGNPDTRNSVSGNGNPDTARPKPCHGAPETLTQRGANTDTGVTPTDITDITERTETTAPALRPDLELRALLDDFGISQPKLNELAATPHLTISRVLELWKRCEGAQRPAALLISLIENDDEHRENSNRFEQWQREAAQRHRKEAEQQKRAKLEHDDLRAALEALSPDQVETYKRQAAETAEPSFVRSIWAQADPASCRALGRAILKLHGGAA